jgi:hypothetical protein
MRARMMIILASATGLFLATGAAHAQTVTCTPITSLPYTINNAGPFCLTGNLSTSLAGDAITVGFSGAVLDLNGYRIIYTGSSSSGSTGVSVPAGHPNVVIRNGLISSFRVGVETSSAGTIVEDLRIYFEGYSGNGVDVLEGADGTVLRRNYIRNADMGVNVSASSVRIIDNDFYGPSTSPYTGGVTAFTDNTFVLGNRFGRLYQGIRYNTGITGKYRDNIMSNVTVPYFGGTDAGNND